MVLKNKWDVTTTTGYYESFNVTYLVNQSNTTFKFQEENYQVGKKTFL
jgi:hypothetical protein